MYKKFHILNIDNIILVPMHETVNHKMDLFHPCRKVCVCCIGNLPLPAFLSGGKYKSKDLYLQPLCLQPVDKAPCDRLLIPRQPLKIRRKCRRQLGALRYS